MNPPEVESNNDIKMEEASKVTASFRAPSVRMVTPTPTPHDVSELLPKEHLRKMAVKFAADATNGCLAELGYFPGVLERVAHLERENLALREDNQKLYADNTMMAEWNKQAKLNLAYMQEKIDRQNAELANLHAQAQAINKAVNTTNKAMRRHSKAKEPHGPTAPSPVPHGSASGHKHTPGCPGPSHNGRPIAPRQIVIPSPSAGQPPGSHYTGSPVTPNSFGYATPTSAVGPMMPPYPISMSMPVPLQIIDLTDDFGEPQNKKARVGGAIPTPRSSGRGTPASIASGSVTPAQATPSTPQVEIPMQVGATHTAGAVASTVEDQEEDDEEEEDIELDADGKIPIDKCLESVYQKDPNDEMKLWCIMCKARYDTMSSFNLPEPRPFICASNEILINHCVQQHPAGWDALRTPPD